MTDVSTRTDAAALSARLRGIYAIPVEDGCGPLNGSTTFERRFETPAIQHEAADTIDRQAAELAQRARDYQKVCDAVVRQRERAERAEAERDTAIADAVQVKADAVEAIALGLREREQAIAERDAARRALEATYRVYGVRTHEPREPEAARTEPGAVGTVSGISDPWLQKHTCDRQPPRQSAEGGASETEPTR